MSHFSNRLHRFFARLVPAAALALLVSLCAVPLTQAQPAPVGGRGGPLGGQNAAPLSGVQQPTQTVPAILQGLTREMMMGSTGGVASALSNEVIRSALANPANAAVVAETFNLFVMSHTPAASANMATTLAAVLQPLATGGGAGSASVLATTLLNFAGSQALVASSPAAAANLANTLAGVARQEAVMRAAPALSAQLAAGAVAIASNSAVIQGAPALAATVASTASFALKDPRVAAAAPDLVTTAINNVTTVVQNPAVLQANNAAVTVAVNNLGINVDLNSRPNSPTGS